MPNKATLIANVSKKSAFIAQQIQLFHVMIFGASQAGGFNAGPSLTSAVNTNVLTLTDGPLDANTSTGVFVNLTGGDTYDNDATPQTYTNVETSANGLGHQFHSLAGGGDEIKICVTIHYRGGTTIQDLSQSGAQSAFGYDQLTAAATRVHSLATGNGWTYTPYMVIEPGGSGANPFQTAIETIISQVRAHVTPTLFSGTMQVLMTQPRVTGTPDFGEQLYDVDLADANAAVNYPRRDGLLASEILPDTIHPTNHGQRRMGIYSAYAAFDDLLGSGYAPLLLDSANATYNSVTDEITVPVLNAEGVLQGTGDFNILVFALSPEEQLTGTWAISGSNVVFTITSTVPAGSRNLEFRAGQGTGTLTDSRSNSGVIFNAADTNPYTILKPVIRYDFASTIVFPDFILQDTYQLNMTPLVSVGVPGWTDFSGNGFTFTDSNTYTIGDGLELFVPASGWLPGGTQGATTGGDTGAFPDDVLKDYFAGAGSVPPSNNFLRIQGAVTTQFFDIEIMCSRVAGGNANRTHDFSIAGATTVNVNGFNCSDNTNNLITATKIQPDGSGHIVITDTLVGDTFWRVNGIRIQRFIFGTP